MNKKALRLGSLLCILALLLNLFSGVSAIAAEPVLSDDEEQAQGQADAIQRALTETGPRVYSGRNLRLFQVPMGGLGSGAIYFDGNAKPHNWDIARLGDSGLVSENTFFAVTVNQGAGKVTKKLRGAQALFDNELTNQPTNSVRSAFGKQGTWFVGTCEIGNNTFNDGLRGSLRSDTFTIPEGCTQFYALVGGGNNMSAEYFVLISAETGEIIGNKLTGANSEAMTARTVSIPAAYQGKEAYFEIVDLATGGWGHINVDNIQLRDGAGTNLNTAAGFVNGDFETGDLTGWSTPAITNPDGFANTELSIAYPFATYSFSDNDMPVKADLEIVNPMIPLNTKDSAIPTVLFNITLTNTTDQPVTASVLSTLANGISGVRANTYSTDANGTYMTLSSDRKDVTQYSGSMALWTGDTVSSYCAGAATAEALVAQMNGDGLNGAATGDAANPVAGLAVPVALGPGESKTVAFNYGWYFPHFLGRELWGSSNTDIGRQYAAYYNTIGDVVADVTARRDQLLSDTQLYIDTIYDTNLPTYFTDSITINSCILRSRVTYVTKDGSIYGWEGSDGNNGVGCCTGNCTHVWNYVQTTANLFPDLARKWKEQDFIYKNPASGMIWTRSNTVPFVENTNGSWSAIDGVTGAIEGAYREHLNAPDYTYLENLWPYIKRSMDGAIASTDPNHDGIMENASAWDTTFDVLYGGVNSFTGAQYLAALRAAEKMALIMGDGESAAFYKELYTKGSDNLDTLTFNGEYYYQIGANQYGTGLLSDNLLGQSHAFLEQLGYVLPKENVNKTLESIFKYNFFYPIGDRYLPAGGVGNLSRTYAWPDDPGLFNCTMPRGGSFGSSPYLQEIWPGFEYEVATAMIYAGMIDEALTIVWAIRDRHDGEGFNQMDEKECGGFYSRSMASYGMLNAAIGLERNGPAKALGFNPNYSPEDVKGYFTYVNGWGSFSQQRETNGISVSQQNQIDVKYGTMDLNSLALYPAGSEDISLRAANATVKLNNEDVAIGKVERNGNQLNIVFAEELKLKAGDVLETDITAVTDNSNIEEWDDVSGTWNDSVLGGRQGTAQAGEHAFSLTREANSFALEGDLSLVAPAVPGSVGFAFGAGENPIENSLVLAWDAQDSKIKLLQFPGAAVLAEAPLTILAEPVQAKLQVSGKIVKGYVNGELVISHNLNSPVTGRVGTYVSGTSALFSNLNLTIFADSVTLNKSSIILYPGEADQLSATVLPTDAADKTVIWSSSDETVATVSDRGLVTAVASGSAVITVATEDGAIEDTCALLVKDDSGEWLEPSAPWANYNGTWSEIPGGWQGVYGGDAFRLSSSRGTDFVYEADLNVISTAGAAAITFRSADSFSPNTTGRGCYTLNVDLTASVVKFFKFPYAQLAAVPMTFQPNTVYHMKVIARGNSFTIFFNNDPTPIITATDNSYRSGRFGVNVWASTGQITNMKYKIIKPSEVTNAAAIPGIEDLTITWDDPVDGLFDKVHVLDAEGQIAAQVNPGVGKAVIAGLESGVAHTYKIVTVDQTGYTSEGVTVTGTPNERILDIQLGISSKIVAECAANIPLTVKPVGFEPDAPVSVVLLDPQGEQFGSETLADSKGYVFFRAPVFPAAGTYTFFAKCGDVIGGKLDLVVVPYNISIWDMLLSKAEDGNTEMVFGETVAPKNGKNFDGCVTVNGSVIRTGTSFSGNTVKIPYIFDELKDGDKIVINSVKYPDLFPSYSFTFTRVFEKSPE